MAHVFIVDENTLPVHLKYQFAGTGAKEYQCEYVENNNAEIEGITERMLTDMIADISRVKRGDKVIFYLQQTKKHEGMFFGSFCIASEPFLCKDNYLIKELHKNLTFRVEIVPDKVYAQGISERECLDTLKGIEHPSQMCWSLIYRKLKGNRGCTMITDYEYNQIMKKIEEKNNGKFIKKNHLDYDIKENEIIPSNQEWKYQGQKDSINIKNRLLYKKNKRNAYESHLQAYILQNLSNINCLKVNQDKINWIGNEMSCGVGMQSIDICLIQENEKEVNIIICELKAVQPVGHIKNQLEKYVEWIKDYIVPLYHKKVILHPTIVAPEPRSKTINIWKTIKDSLICESEEVIIKPIRYIGFAEQNNKIVFQEVTNG